ncbi:hypothetical protein TRICI_002521 [Trichomonascus ciferrii]|uniref:Protein kinase domain-containing protein n=1 Tax=Trichomonascus ciferrii TaxID=44093 RepID=A0A642V6L3_9ASCO|nr:hypothetical protein TRICI_002521 [Trichomonascus ciferrii]
MQDAESYANLREVEFLSRVSPHQNLVRAHEIFVDNAMLQCHIVMESMEMNLYDLIKSRNGMYFPSRAIKELLYQIASGLNHIHQHGFFHRDVKPENILITPNSGQLQSYSLKLADFGLSRHVSCKDPYTTYVSTRWYRAPELIFRCSEYTYCIDIWAFGAVAAELANLRPLFPGKDEMDLIERHISVLGTPDVSIFAGYWDHFYTFMSSSGFSIEPHVGLSPSQLLHNEDYDLALLISYCIKWNPEMRISASALLRLPYFQSLNEPVQHLHRHTVNMNLPGNQNLVQTQSINPALCSSTTLSQGSSSVTSSATYSSNLSENKAKPLVSHLADYQNTYV